ncbi:hypothetical protein [Streptomyces pseudovenezuelae]|uniref:hypothetical protein n=1 Tax=Streptomyces pseudovenezuelae TaxID=67350 RepID=UPI002E801E76|nr:hypothetical protein [Streptomyces pseudovenezuelae]WUA94521.1 hypothetical protein OHO81_44920 [Streptomyces pseudovenezuelae]
MATRTAKTTAKKTAAKKTTAARAPRTRKTTTAKKTTPARLSLVKPTPTDTGLPARPRDFITDAQIYATHAAKKAGIPVHRIREWTDHHDGTATRVLTDGYLHYTHETRTLTWRASCRMGALHTYVLDSPSTAAQARVQAATCEELHADLSTVPPLTPDELEAEGLLQTPTWARPDELAGEITATIPVPAEPLHRATASAADTQPMSTQAIADHIAQQLADQQPKEHPQP